MGRRQCGTGGILWWGIGGPGRFGKAVPFRIILHNGIPVQAGKGFGHVLFDFRSRGEGPDFVIGSRNDIGRSNQSGILDVQESQTQPLVAGIDGSKSNDRGHKY